MLHTDDGYGQRLPLDFCGNLFRQLAPMMASSVRMAIEGTSVHTGAPPAWLRRASDVRVLGWSEDASRNTLVHLNAPPLGEAAEEVYSQGTLWETRPSPDDTAVNVFARATRDVRTGNPDSPLYDLHLLKHMSHSAHLFEHKLVALDAPEGRATDQAARFDREVAAKALELTQRTPSPRQVRIVGHLDMIRHSTRTFEVCLLEGKAVRGVLEHAEQLDQLRTLLGQTIVVIGKAVYRPSGSLLRVDAQAVDSASGDSRLFAKVPPPLDRHPVAVRFRVGEQIKKGVPGFFGKWPGNETDEELLAMLRDVRE